MTTAKFRKVKNPTENSRFVVSEGGTGPCNISGIGLIAIEREEQLFKHGYIDDSIYVHNELLYAAMSYIDNDSENWPWDKETFHPGDRISNLTKAGALIAAEIDRILQDEQQR